MDPTRARVRPWLIAVVAVLIVLAFDLLVLTQHGMDPESFVLKGTKFSEQDPQGTVGYDGQFVYYIAEDPLGAYQMMDIPSHRYKRVVYPALAWLLSFGGQRHILPWSMLFINVLAVGAGAWSLAALLSAHGVSGLYALLFPCYVGTMFSVRADLNEPLAFALALCGWYVYARHQVSLSLILFALAGLGKEVALLFPLALAINAFWSRDFQEGLRLGLSSAGIYVAWYILLLMIFREHGVVLAPDLPKLVPFSGIRLVRDPVHLAVLSIWVIAPAVAAGLAALIELILRKADVSRKDALLVLLQFMLVAFLPAWTWGDPLAVIRVGIGVVTAALIWAASSHPRALPYAAALWGPSMLLLFIMPGLVWRA
jgi:hypothetical protein